MSAEKVALIDYRKVNAANSLLPKPSILSSCGWSHLHLEVYQQPKFEIIEHQHTMHVIAHATVSSGFPASSKGERWLDGKLHHETRHQGDIAILPAGLSHRCNWDSSVEFAILALEPALLQQVGQDIVNGDRIELIPEFMNRQDALLQGIFLTLREEVEVGKIGGDLLVDSLKTTLAIHLLRKYCTTQPKLSSHSDGLSQLTLQKVREYIHEHLDGNLKLVELSAIAQISPYHFLRLFKQQVGITPHQYILQSRIEKAKYLLQHSNLSIANIALRTGFSDQSHLTRCFKRMVGVTPKKRMKDKG
ncbi:helix-turn-helix domain-containing protein [Scytonema sp. UIC 10036]|uniref:helix-turn-helix domain-containing protein n=1 Tax=Scytonema sp. UIC 10036 TaxID=2304196 RepID=UPI0012DAE854|nr:AraC family transcriptional regulator [Scytonema sp. UIC 10036]MUG98056.1 helix-turn-helix domain-containing protein [Scytonema sp. UIC 10036]